MRYRNVILHSKIWITVAAAAAVVACEKGTDEAESQVAPAELDPGAAEPEGDRPAEPSRATAEELSPPASIPPEALGKYEIDPVHSAVVFRADHFGLGYVHGLFNDVTGAYELAENPSESSVKIEIGAKSLFSGNKQRDDDLKGPDFLNASQFPKITFQSTKVNKTSDGFKVEGDLTLRGETKPLTITMKPVGSGAFPMDNSYRSGFHGVFTIDRTDFGIDYLANNIAPEIELTASFEGVKE